MKILKIIIAITVIINGNIMAQNLPFEISLEPLTIAEIGGIQSYAFGQANGKWLIVGGRLDGLHRRQPWASFDIAGHNNQLIIIDPLTQQSWAAPLNLLPVEIEEHLSATNMEFYQEGEYLYCVGGYGFSPSANDHITYDKLTAIKVPDLIEAIINEQVITPFFRQITDTAFQVTGGRLRKIYDTYYLLGGQKFMGRYNPMGPDNGPGFEQEYTNAVRIFDIEDDGVYISITHHESYYDTINLHRRDYNAEPQILPNGNQAITMFSGVFQPEIDLPFLNAVTVDTSGYTVDDTFQQHYNHYHCPVLPMYSESGNEMYNVFFGGIAQFYDDNGTLVQDNNVPFVNTIAVVVRDANGLTTEHKLPVEMPALLGAGAEFIPNLVHPQFENDVLKFDSLTEEGTLVGYIYGGISSSAANIFFINNGTQSNASNQVFKVFVEKGPTSAIQQSYPNENALDLILYPNPAKEEVNISFNLTKTEDVRISIYNAEGKLLEEALLPGLIAGKHVIVKRLSGYSNADLFLIRVQASQQEATQKLRLQD